MKVTETSFRDLVVLEPRVLGDARGYFIESYNKKTLSELGLDYTFVQDNQSSSRRGVLRGLHFQQPPFAQTKLVRVLSGVILDVVVDLRRAEPTFGKHFTLEISAENKKQLLIPKGFAHGFVVLSDVAEVFYKCDEYYNAASDAGILYSSLDIDWKLPPDVLVLSGKDQTLPLFSDFDSKF